MYLRQHGSKAEVDRLFAVLGAGGPAYREMVQHFAAVHKELQEESVDLALLSLDNPRLVPDAQKARGKAQQMEEVVEFLQKFSR